MFYKFGYNIGGKAGLCPVAIGTGGTIIQSS